MTDEEIKKLKEKYQTICDLQRSIEQLHKEIGILKDLLTDDKKIKECYYTKVFPWLCPIDGEWDLQKILCTKIVSYALELREKQLQKCNKNLADL